MIISSDWDQVCFSPYLLAFTLCTSIKSERSPYTEIGGGSVHILHRPSLWRSNTIGLAFLRFLESG